MMVGWRDLRAKCKACGERAAFTVVYTNDDLLEGYIRDGTREEGFCLKHLPKEVEESRRDILDEVQKPFRGG